MFMRLFQFDSLVTPSIAKFIFYFGVVISALGALGVIGTGAMMMQYQFAAGIGYVIGGLLMIVGGIILSRITTEMVLVLFMIRDELAWQREQRQAAAQPHPAAAE
jgi:hypothetical protein